VIEKRACADIEAFNRYFRFQVDESDLSTTDLADLERSFQDSKTFGQLLLNAKDPDKLSRTIRAVSDMAGQPLSVEATSNIISGFMNVADELPERVGLDDIFFGATNEAIRAIRNLLIAIPNQRVRAEVILRSFASGPRSLQMPILLVERLTAAKTEQSKSASIFADEDIQRIHLAAANHVKSKMEDFSLFSDGRSAYPVYAWMRLAPETAILDIQRLTVSNDDALIVSQGVVYEPAGLIG
jgi:hypothetical protein